jgi:hypothetical protein
MWKKSRGRRSPKLMWILNNKEIFNNTRRVSRICLRHHRVGYRQEVYWKEKLLET